MANVKITDLAALTNPASTDVLPIVDVGEDVTKKVSVADLLKNDLGTASAPSIAFDGDPDTGIYSPGANKLGVSTGGVRRLVIDAEGRFLLGAASANSLATTLLLQGSANSSSGPSHLRFAAGTATPGATSTLGQISFTDNGHATAASIYAARDNGTWTPGSSQPTRLVFTTTADGNGTPAERMSIESNGTVKLNTTTIFNSNNGGIYLGQNGLYPTDNTGALSDNSYDLGNAVYRWRTIYAGTGTINTSDANLKQDVESLDAAELSVATAIKGLIKKFRFTDAVTDKGDEARIHVGVIAQEVEQAFIDEGLDPRRYGLFCEDELEDGTKRLGIRYNELLAFVIAAI